MSDVTGRLSVPEALPLLMQGCLSCYQISVKHQISRTAFQCLCVSFQISVFFGCFSHFLFLNSCSFLLTVPFFIPPLSSNHMSHFVLPLLVIAFFLSFIKGAHMMQPFEPVRQWADRRQNESPDVALCWSNYSFDIWALSVCTHKSGLVSKLCFQESKKAIWKYGCSASYQSTTCNTFECLKLKGRHRQSLEHQYRK